MSDTLFSISLSSSTLIVLGVVALVAGLIGWAIAYVRYRGEIAGLDALLAAETRNHADRVDALEQSMQDSFANLSNEALAKNNSLFLDLAGQAIARQSTNLDASARSRENAVTNMVKPLHEALKETRAQVQRLEKDRREAQGALAAHLKLLRQDHRLLHQETRNLATAMRRPEVRGRWGELTLRRLVELAGLSKHCDFSEQTHTSTEDGAIRPDLMIHLPGDRKVVVDAKTPLDSYLSAIEATNDAARDELLARHATSVKHRIDELAAKSYWQHFDDSLDFVILFIPGDQFLTAALDQDPDLLERALSQRVIPSTPTSLVALLRAIAFGWRQEALTSNAREIRTHGEQLLDRLSLFAGHLDKLGRGLDGTVGHFNRLTGSFDSRVLPAARRLEQFGIESPRDFPTTRYVEQRVRGTEDPADPETPVVQNVAAAQSDRDA